jgi:hypothetical protein
MKQSSEWSKFPTPVRLEGFNRGIKLIFDKGQKLGKGLQSISFRFQKINPSKFGKGVNKGNIVVVPIV